MPLGKDLIFIILLQQYEAAFISLFCSQKSDAPVAVLAKIIHVCLSGLCLAVKGLVQTAPTGKTATNLSRGKDDGGKLRAVPPLCQEGEGEGLDEDGRDKAVPLLLRDGRRCSSLHVWSAVHQFGPLELRRRRPIGTARKVPNVLTLRQQTRTSNFPPLWTLGSNNLPMKPASHYISREGALTQSCIPDRNNQDNRHL